jgi:hypothetical protein
LGCENENDEGGHANETTGRWKESYHAPAANENG